MNKTNQLESERLLSLDFFRGLTMFLLVVAITGFFSCLTSPKLEGTFIYAIGKQFDHHPWHGLRFWDLIQPFFMFIVGVAMPLSYSKRIRKGATHKEIRNHIVRRSVLLLLLGWGLYCIPYGRITFYFQNVLAQLSVTIMISFLIMRKSIPTQIIISVLLLAINELLFRTFWIEGFNQPFVADHNFGAWLDMQISGQLSAGHWTSINAIPTTAHTIWGVLAGKLLMSDRTKKKKLQVLLIVGVIGLIIGYGLDPVTPIIKRISTSSFVFASGGWTFLALALSFWLIDMLKFQKGVRFFAIVGMNPLFIYLFAEAGGSDMLKKIVLPFTATAFGWAGSLSVSLATTAVASFLMWYLCYWMYKNKIFIKI